MIKFSYLLLFFCVEVYAANDSFYLFKKNTEYTQDKIDIEGYKTEYSLATHFYKNTSEKLMVIIHGYLDNCGYMTHINTYLWEKDYSILCIELPGHGLSSGARGNIDSFKTYQKIIASIPKKYFDEFSSVDFLAHSTGTVTLLTHLIKNNDHPFNKIILLSPLVRSRLWYPSLVIHTVAKYFTDTIPRTNKDDPSFDKFKEVMNKDPNLISFMSLDWFEKLRDWNNDLKGFNQKQNHKLNIIFSENDEVIDTDFNKIFYAEHFPNAKITTLKNATHHMDYNGEDILKKFYNKLDVILK